MDSYKEKILKVLERKDLDNENVVQLIYNYSKLELETLSTKKYLRTLLDKDNLSFHQLLNEINKYINNDTRKDMLSFLNSINVSFIEYDNKVSTDSLISQNVEMKCIRQSNNISRTRCGTPYIWSTYKGYYNLSMDSENIKKINNYIYDITENNQYQYTDYKYKAYFIPGYKCVLLNTGSIYVFISKIGPSRFDKENEYIPTYIEENPNSVEKGHICNHLQFPFTYDDEGYLQSHPLLQKMRTYLS